MNESALLAAIAARSVGMGGAFPRVIEGPGDDCAVVRAHGGAVLLTVDQLVEGRHFRAGTPLDLVARKAIARSVSDIAAMAGTPTAALATGAMRAGFPQAQADELCARLKHWSEHWGCPLVGGDIASSSGGSDPLVLTVTVMGEVHATRGAVLRRTAMVGDGVYVTGTLGGSFDAATGLGRHLTFEPRVREAAALADVLGERLHAMMDVSDGLGRDAGRMARASGVCLSLDAGALPCTAGADWRGALRDGEDYELLFTATGEVASEVAGVMGPTRVTRIGAVVEWDGLWCAVREPGGEMIEGGEMGWEH